ncbi:MAG: xanthine dehydrogenase family protein molybdopterin-binding subunit [Candidatus Eremiobacteraeota bacterium]|nr:xanthine dehydrogenase family protein molybdopterin-binding subunit [Candidatus Eremiobacteraeota bacterium]MBV8355311.1 xanthine dehydrogenase family protein molybdopterin-binding subunit [Candidatus Eremiobacteraeota bacterium]
MDVIDLHPPRALGAAHDRLDGREKTSGEARYAADWRFENLLHGVLVQSTVAQGHIVNIDLSKAEAAEGVARIFTPDNTPRFGQLSSPPLGQGYLPLQDRNIHYEGQHVARVLADTLEQAQHAAKLVDIFYAPKPWRTDFRRHLDRAIAVQHFFENDTQTGDLDAAMKTAEEVVDVTYSTADRHHVALEPSSTVADWREGKMTIYDATQYVFGVRLAVSSLLGIPIEDVRVIAKFVGGGFGCKGFIWPHQILAAMASKEVGRPVKLTLTRAQTFTSHGYQCATEQHLVIGAKKDGTLVAMRHENWTPTSTVDDYVEYPAAATRSLYACPAIATSHRVVRVNRNLPTPMRAPHEGPGAVGLECALDELAWALNVDPIELRIRNHADKDPTTGEPFSQKNLLECYRVGAERFGWERRAAAPGTMRDGRNLVGYGMASAIMTTFRQPASARVTLEFDGSVLVEAGTQDIGGGQYTILPQIAADALGVSLERVRIVLGDTTLPETGGTFGSSSTLSVGSAVLAAARKLKEELDAGASPPVSAEASWQPSDEGYSIQSFGAVFAEVHLDSNMPVPRVARLVGVYSAGRIINPKTARSQIIGGMTWGIGQALLEASELEVNLGRYVSKNLTRYAVPSNADVRELDVTFVDETDENASLVGAKGIGELGAVGVGPAILNAIFHATTVRVRHVPVRIEDLL